MSGKGSRQRPLAVPKEKFNESWDRIFSSKKPEPTDKQPTVRGKNKS